MAKDPIHRLREVCATLPEAAEGISVHHPSFKVRGKAFVMLAEPVRDGDPASLWIKSTRDAQQELLAIDGERFYVPPYLGPKGWIGVRLGARADWKEIQELVTDAYRLAAPKRLIQQLDAQ